MVWRSLSDIALSDTKQLLVGCREQLRKKHTEFDSKVSHLMKSMKSKKLLLFWSVKKSFSLRNLTKISNLIRVGVKQVTCLFEDWKKLSVWGNVLLRVFALEIGERKAYIKQTGPNVSVLLNRISALEYDGFMQISHTV